MESGPMQRSNHNKLKPKINIKRKNPLQAKSNNMRGMSKTGRKVLRKSKSRRGTKKLYSKVRVRSNSRVGLNSTRNKEVSNFGTLASDILINDNKDRKLRIAKPPQNLISVSDHHWNQITHNFSNNKSRRTSRRVSSQNSQKDITPNETDEFVNKIIDYSSSMTKDNNDRLRVEITKKNIPNTKYKTFSFLSNLGGKELANPTIPSTLYDPSYCQKRQMSGWGDTDQNKVTIITNGNVDHHELDIQERRIHRKNIMDLTARGIIDPTKPKVRALRPSSSKPTLMPKNIPILPKREIEPAITPIKEARRRPMSANPKFITISGRNRPVSAQIQMGDRIFAQVEESIESMDKESDLNIPEVSEVPKFDETEEIYAQKEHKKFSDKIMNSQPTTASIFKNDKDFNLPYPDLFDRTERTFAA